MRASATFCLAAIAMALEACGSMPQDGLVYRPDPLAVGRGEHLAQFRCAVCHQIGPSGESPSLMAPPFHRLYLSAGHLAFKKSVAETFDDERHAMPGYNLSRDEIDDLVAYLESNRRPASRP